MTASTVTMTTSQKRAIRTMLRAVRDGASLAASTDAIEMALTAGLLSYIERPEYRLTVAGEDAGRFARVALRRYQLTADGRAFIA